MTPKVLRRKLARDFPLQRRLVVLFDDCDEKNLAEISMDDSTIYISLGPSTPPEQAHHLLHEYAHAIVSERHGKQMPGHTLEWAAVYSKLYKRYYD